MIRDISPDWQLEQEFGRPYFSDIISKLKRERQECRDYYPDDASLFKAFALTPFSRLRVVILGQDPYHNPAQANGLAFSVPRGTAIPPSLRNIYKELAQDLNCPIPDHGDLSEWAAQGVLLLNTCLTVQANKPMSHRDLGWQVFTDAVIRKISDQKDKVVFMLWGNFAAGKKVLIDSQKHLVLTAPHPSPLSANRGFFGCGHFSKANIWLAQQGLEPINWCL